MPAIAAGIVSICGTPRPGDDRCPSTRSRRASTSNPAASPSSPTSAIRRAISSAAMPSERASCRTRFISFLDEDNGQQIRPLGLRVFAGIQKPSAHRDQLFCKLPRFDGVDLQCDVAAIDTALRKCSAGKPQTRLSCAGPHVAQFLRLVVKAPDRSDTLGDGCAEARGYDVIQALVAGGQNDDGGA